MADIDINVQTVGRSGVTPSYSGSLLTTNSYFVLNDGKSILHFKKTGAGICTVTVYVTTTVDGQAVASKTFDVPASTGDKMAGPWPPGTYNDGNGKLKFTCSEITGLTVGVMRID